tara:strand:- start:151 stop:471 length:321 start_codon:yes stop_codon:yes gene_type:complete
MEILGSVGIYEHEKKEKQKILINLEICLKKNDKIITDKLQDVTDYCYVRKIVLGILKKKHYNLLEKLADEILNKILEINSVENIKVKITKPDVFDDCKVSYELSSF